MKEVKGLCYSEMYFFTGLAVTALIFVAVFYGYSLPWQPLMYGSVISLVLLSAIAIIRRIMLRKRINDAKAWIDSVLLAVPSQTKTGDPLEQQYRHAICDLAEQIGSLSHERNRDRAEAGDYYSTWTHQIKLPLAALRLLLQTEDFPQKKEISYQLARIEEYVEMVLGFVRTDAMSGDLLVEPVALDDIVRSSAKKHSLQFIRKEIALEYTSIKKEALTDAKWLGFVIDQIISNSLKYTKSGHISITIEEGEPFWLVIEDTGRGITPEDLPRIFEKGFTGYNGRNQQSSTGIGLYLCKRILDQLAHPIEIQSTPGKGTIVRIGIYGNNKLHD